MVKITCCDCKNIDNRLIHPFCLKCRNLTLPRLSEGCEDFEEESGKIKDKIKKSSEIKNESSLSIRTVYKIEDKEIYYEKYDKINKKISITAYIENEEILHDVISNVKALEGKYVLND